MTREREELMGQALEASADACIAAIQALDAVADVIDATQSVAAARAQIHMSRETIIERFLPLVQSYAEAASTHRAR